MNLKKFVHLDSNGSPWGIVSAEQLWANVYALKYNKPENRLDQSIWRDLFTQAKEAALSFNAEMIGVRIRLEYEPETFRKILEELRFAKKSGRIEYQSKVTDLPGEEETPFQWKTAQELNWSFDQIVAFTKEITRDALDIDPNEKVEDFVQDWLVHHELTCGPNCIAIGFLNDQPSALTVVQINSEIGWSRISYMGIIASHRAKGLGKWVHRHGFTMMKQQGGNLYHGGTHIDNGPMRKLFESHGCDVFCEMEEWVYEIRGENQ